MDKMTLAQRRMNQMIQLTAALFSLFLAGAAYAQQLPHMANKISAGD
jgi:hypothetical protein